MSKLGDLTEFIRLILFSGWVVPDAGDRPVSAMLVAKVESGKTSILDQFQGTKGTLYKNDVTEYGLIKAHLKDFARGKVKHIIIPDFIKSINRKKTTVDTLITFFNSLIEEGLLSVSTYAVSINLKEPVHCAVLTSIAVEDFSRMQKRLAAVGFLSRFMILSYDYDSKAVDKISKDIAEARGGWSKETLTLPAKEVRVNLPPALAKQMIPRARQIGERLHAYGFRAQHMLQQLSKASALEQGRDEVKMDDIVRVLRLSDDYLGLRYSKIGLSGKVEHQIPLGLEV